MVSLLDSGILEHFTIVFSLIFIIAVVYGLLQITKTFGDNKLIQALIALTVGVLVVMVPDVVELISTMIPWFIMLFIFILFLLMTYKIFGATDSDISSALSADRSIIWVIIIIAIIIVISSFSSVYGQRLLTGEKDASDTEIDSGVIGEDTEIYLLSSSSDRLSISFHILPP